MYQRTCALRDNPFNPIKLAVGAAAKRQFYANLLKSPLRIHSEADLLQMYCPKAGTFQENESEFKRILLNNGYEFEPSVRGVNSAIFLISGPRGSGKTTLASYFIHLAKSIKPNGGPDWSVFENASGTDPLPAGDYKKTLEALKQKMQEKTDQTSYVCVLLDNMVHGALDAAVSLYEDFGDRSRLFFVTTDDIELLNQNFDNHPSPIHTFRTSELSEAGAVSYVRHRLSIFRDPRLPVLEEFPLFPFEEGQLVGAVQDQTAGAPRPSITLRQLNVHLNKRLQDHHAKLLEDEPDIDVATLPPLKLSEHLIKLW